MPSADLQTFINELDKAINEAVRQGVDAEQIEKVLQKRAQDMREYASEEQD